MKCVFCGGETISKLVTFTYEENGRYLIIENVPAEVCQRCGEKTYSPEVTDSILEIARANKPPAKTINVPVFDFAEIK